MTQPRATPQPPADLPGIIAEELRRSGQVRARYATPHERDRARAAGRQAGRLLNRPVRTFDAPAADTDERGTVTVVITDWGERNPLESRLTESRANNAIDRALNTP